MKHEATTCHLKDDAVRCLEIQLDKEYKKEIGLQCRFCEKVYCNRSSWTRHFRKGCAPKQKYRKMLEEELSMKGGNTVINNITNNHNQVLVLNTGAPIQMTDYGHPNMDHISKEDVYTMFLQSDGYLSQFMERLVMKIYGDQNHPENHTMCITDMKGWITEAYNGYEYVNRECKKVLNHVMDVTADKGQTELITCKEKPKEKRENLRLDRYIDELQDVKDNKEERTNMLPYVRKAANACKTVFKETRTKNEMGVI